MFSEVKGDIAASSDIGILWMIHQRTFLRTVSRAIKKLGADETDGEAAISLYDSPISLPETIA